MIIVSLTCQTLAHCLQKSLKRCEKIYKYFNYFSIGVMSPNADSTITSHLSLNTKLPT